MAKPKNILIDKDLFINICKYFLVGEEYADCDSICEALNAKINALSEREAYARRLQQEIFWKRRQKRQFRSVQLLWQTNSEDITSSVLRSMREKATAVRFVKI